MSLILGFSAVFSARMAGSEFEGASRRTTALSRGGSRPKLLVPAPPPPPCVTLLPPRIDGSVVLGAWWRNGSTPFTRTLGHFTGQVQVPKVNGRAGAEIAFGNAQTSRASSTQTTQAPFTPRLSHRHRIATQLRTHGAASAPQRAHTHPLCQASARRLPVDGPPRSLTHHASYSCLQQPSSERRPRTRRNLRRRPARSLGRDGTLGRTRHGRWRPGCAGIAALEAPRRAHVRPCARAPRLVTRPPPRRRSPGSPEAAPQRPLRRHARGWRRRGWRRPPAS